MTREIEIEFKNMLTKDEFERAMNYYNITAKDFFSQTNYYFDTKDLLLKQAESALRLREINNQYEITLKKPDKIGLLEITDKVNKDTAMNLVHTQMLPDGEVKSELIKMNIPISELTNIGSLTTHRAEHHDRDGLLVLDHSYYLNCEDYELEYEAKNRDSGKKRFLQILKQLNIKEKHADNKIKRLFKAIIDKDQMKEDEDH